MPFFLALALVVFLAGCAAEALTDAGIIEGFQIYLEPGAQLPRGLAEVIRVVRASKPDGGSGLPGGTIKIFPGPFECGPMKVWGCSSMNTMGAGVMIAYAEDAAESALVEELGHIMWSPLCGKCEDWTTADGGRVAAFQLWLDETRKKAMAATANV